MPQHPTIVASGSKSFHSETRSNTYAPSDIVGLSSCMAVRRLAAAVDSFLLKFTIEELLGWPVQLISGGLLDGIESVLNLTGAASKYEALASGEAHIHPEARQLVALCRLLRLIRSRYPGKYDTSNWA